MTTASPAREDVHRPSVLNPPDYRWVAYTDDGGQDRSPLLDGDAAAIEGPNVNRIHPGGCDCCGHRPLTHRYFYRHIPTGDVIVLGWNCVEKMGFESAEARGAAERAKRAQAAANTEAKAAEWLAANPEAVEALALADEHHILADMAAKLRRYGSLSERQVEFAQTLAAEVRERQAAPPEPEPVPIPAEVLDGRATITGEIVAGKWRETEYGGAYKIVVRDDRGFKVWGTAAETLWEDNEIPNGIRVTFDARIRVADDDPAFGFFSRPTKARRIEDAGPAEAPAAAPGALLAELEAQAGGRS